MVNPVLQCNSPRPPNHNGGIKPSAQADPAPLSGAWNNGVAVAEMRWVLVMVKQWETWVKQRCLAMKHFLMMVCGHGNDECSSSWSITTVVTWTSPAGSPMNPLWASPHRAWVRTEMSGRLQPWHTLIPMAWQGGWLHYPTDVGMVPLILCLSTVDGHWRNWSKGSWKLVYQ